LEGILSIINAKEGLKVIVWIRFGDNINLGNVLKQDEINVTESPVTTVLNITLYSFEG
jgi:hypothetical protein